jgi:hypothetical protein
MSDAVSNNNNELVDDNDDPNNMSKPIKRWMFILVVVMLGIVLVAVLAISLVNQNRINNFDGDNINTRTIPLRALSDEVRVRLLDNRGEQGVTVVTNLGKQTVNIGRTFNPGLVPSSPYLLLFSSGFSSYDRYELTSVPTATSFNANVFNNRRDFVVTPQLKISSTVFASFSYSPVNRNTVLLDPFEPVIVSLVYDRLNINAGPSKVAFVVPEKDDTTRRNQWQVGQELLALPDQTMGAQPLLSDTGSVFTAFDKPFAAATSDASFLVSYGNGDIVLARTSTSLPVPVITQYTLNNTNTLRQPTMVEIVTLGGGMSLTLAQHFQVSRIASLVSSINYVVQDFVNETANDDLDSVLSLPESNIKTVRKVFSVTRLKADFTALVAKVGNSFAPLFFDVVTTPSATIPTSMSTQNTSYTFPTATNLDPEFGGVLYQVQFVGYDDSTGSVELCCVYEIRDNTTSSYVFVLFTLADGSIDFVRKGFIYEASGEFSKRFVVKYIDDTRMSVSGLLSGITAVVDVNNASSILPSFPPSPITPVDTNFPYRGVATGSLPFEVLFTDKTDACLIAFEGQLYVAAPNELSWLIQNTNSQTALSITVG